MAPWRSTGLTLTQSGEARHPDHMQFPAHLAQLSLPVPLQRCWLTCLPSIDASTALGGFNATRGASDQESCRAGPGTQRGGCSEAPFTLQARELGPCLPGTSVSGDWQRAICRHFLGQQNRFWVQRALGGSSLLMGTPAFRAEILGGVSVPGSPPPPIKSAALPTVASVRSSPTPAPRCDS